MPDFNPPDTSIAVYLLAGAAVLIFFRYWLSPHRLRTIPTVGGPSAPILSYIGSYNYIHHSRSILQEGYDKYKGGMFKVPMLESWLVVVTGPKLMDELQRFSDEYVSFTAANAEARIPIMFA
ncbi:hypothetical protein EIP86_003571 [Pleurotus ostreatoroseus]|nr:hypothetical protein EIP86_003571 [Pleurotus ostreatoroseus]